MTFKEKILVPFGIATALTLGGCSEETSPNGFFKCDSDEDQKRHSTVENDATHTKLILWTENTHIEVIREIEQGKISDVENTRKTAKKFCDTGKFVLTNS